MINSTTQQLVNDILEVLTKYPSEETAGTLKTHVSTIQAPPSTNTIQGKDPYAGIIVEKDKPIPGKKTNHNYPFAALEIGDSFFAAVPSVQISSILPTQQKYLKRKFTTRTVVENGVKGCRVWRIEKS